MLMRTLIVTLCVIGASLAERSPVFLWGAVSPSKPALQTIQQAEFGDIVVPLLKNHMVVAFQEDGLTANDFLCANTETQQSCYAHLQGVSPKTYYASVENPGEALRSVATQREFNTVGSTGKLENPLECTIGKAVVINFDKSEAKERGNTLEAHDAIIDAITKETSCSVVYMYFAAPSTTPTVQKRVRRDVPSTGGTVWRQGAQFLIYYTNLAIVDSSGAGSKTELNVSSMKVTNESATLFNVELATSNSKPITFDISLSSGYYQMKNVAYNGMNYLSYSVNAPTTFSFHCGNLTLGCNATGTTACTTSIVWESLQLQAPFGGTTNETFAFGDGWDCVPFFTPGILSGLFVVILLLSIVFTGICWMMDINTMDRFDDPKGKTITINAAE